MGFTISDTYQEFSPQDLGLDAVDLKTNTIHGQKVIDLRGFRYLLFFIEVTHDGAGTAGTFNLVHRPYQDAAGTIPLWAQQIAITGMGAGEDGTFLLKVTADNDTEALLDSGGGTPTATATLSTFVPWGFTKIGLDVTVVSDADTSTAKMWLRALR